MTDTITATSRDTAAGLVRTYHLTRVTADTDSKAHITITADGRLIDAGQTPDRSGLGGELRTLGRHVAALHSALRTPRDNGDALLRALTDFVEREPLTD